MTTRAIICISCKHFQEGPREGQERFAYCRAFPAGIPRQVFYSEFVHLSPYPGDNGLQWEPFRPGVTDDTEVYLYDPEDGPPNIPEDLPVWAWRGLKEPILAHDRIPHDE